MVGRAWLSAWCGLASSVVSDITWVGRLRSHYGRISNMVEFILEIIGCTVVDLVYSFPQNYSVPTAMRWRRAGEDLRTSSFGAVGDPGSTSHTSVVINVVVDGCG